MIRLRSPWLLFCCAPLALALGGCGAGPEAPAGAGKPPVAVETAPATVVALTEAVPVTGSLAAKRSAEVKSELAGIYREVYVSEWVPVRRGQPLARIQADETATQAKRAEAGALRAKVEAERAEREAQRLHLLKEAGLATQQQLDDAESAAAAARAGASAADEELAQLRIRLDKSVIRAPIDGVVAQRTVNVGDLAGADAGGRTIFRIVDNRRLDLTATVPARDLAKVAVGQRLEFTCDGRPGETFAGAVKHVNPSVNPVDRSLQVMAEVDNGDGRLKDGLFVTGRIVTGTRDQVLLVPRSALSGLDLAAARAVLFVVAGDRAQRREVRTGASAGDQIEIVAGLKVGERYVTRGAFNLRDGDRVDSARK